MNMGKIQPNISIEKFGVLCVNAIGIKLKKIVNVRGKIVICLFMCFWTKLNENMFE